MQIKACCVHGLKGYNASIPHFGTTGCVFSFLLYFVVCVRCHVRISHLLMNFLLSLTSDTQSQCTRAAGRCNWWLVDICSGWSSQWGEEAGHDRTSQGCCRIGTEGQPVDRCRESETRCHRGWGPQAGSRWDPSVTQSFPRVHWGYCFFHAERRCSWSHLFYGLLKPFSRSTEFLIFFQVCFHKKRIDAKLYLPNFNNFNKNSQLGPWTAYIVKGYLCR